MIVYSDLLGDSYMIFSIINFPNTDEIIGNNIRTKLALEEAEI